MYNTFLPTETRLLSIMYSISYIKQRCSLYVKDFVLLSNQIYKELRHIMKKTICAVLAFQASVRSMAKDARRMTSQENLEPKIKFSFIFLAEPVRICA